MSVQNDLQLQALHVDMSLLMHLGGYSQFSYLNCLHVQLQTVYTVVVMLIVEFSFSIKLCY